MRTLYFFQLCKSSHIMTSILWFMIRKDVKQVKFCDILKMVRDGVSVIFSFYQLRVDLFSFLLSPFHLLPYKEKKS